MATSHFSQGNTIEFEMAIHWRALQEKSDLWWRALHEVIIECDEFHTKTL